jgi:hemerythrin superfamily protein
MGSAVEDRAKAAELPEGDVIRILLEQHATVHDLFDEVTSTTGVARQQAFDRLRALLAVHETAEELVLRPVSARVAGEEVTDARNDEEAEANKMLAELEKLDIDAPDFLERLGAFRTAVVAHAEAEESEEFPRVLAEVDAEERRKLGRTVEAVEAVAPTHPHPTAAGSPVKQAVLGPFASLVDRAKDAINAAADER